MGRAVIAMTLAFVIGSCQGFDFGRSLIVDSCKDRGKFEQRQQQYECKLKEKK